MKIISLCLNKLIIIMKKKNNTYINYFNFGHHKFLTEMIVENL